MKKIEIVRFEESPKAWQDKSRNGGDEDWIIFWSDTACEGDAYDIAVRLAVCDFTEAIPVEGGNIIITCHA